MADWCPSAEKRNIMIGVSASLTFAIDAFQLSMSTVLTPLTRSPDLSCIRSAELPRGLQGGSRIWARSAAHDWGVKYFDTRWSRKAPVQPDEPLSVDDGDVDDKY